MAPGMIFTNIPEFQGRDIESGPGIYYAVAQKIISTGGGIPPTHTYEILDVYIDRGKAEACLKECRKNPIYSFELLHMTVKELPVGEEVRITS